MRRDLVSALFWLAVAIFAAAQGLALKLGSLKQPGSGLLERAKLEGQALRGGEDRDGQPEQGADQVATHAPTSPARPSWRGLRRPDALLGSRRRAARVAPSLEECRCRRAS